MPKYNIRYTMTEYYEKQYESDNYEGALDAWSNDDRLFEGKPYESILDLDDVESCATEEE